MELLTRQRLRNPSWLELALLGMELRWLILSLRASVCHRLGGERRLISSCVRLIALMNILLGIMGESRRGCFVCGLLLTVCTRLWNFVNETPVVCRFN